MRQVAAIALLSWFTGGVLTALIEVIALPSDPNYSTLLQLLPLIFLVGGIWFINSQYQKLWARNDRTSSRLKLLMGVGWFGVFGVDAGVASLNNMATEIFHGQLPYYYQGVSLAQKIVALIGIFTLGIVSILSLREHQGSQVKHPGYYSTDFWEKPLTNIGIIALLLGVVLGLAQYWQPVIFAAFVLLLSGTVLYPLGRLTEKNSKLLDDETGTTA